MWNRREGFPHSRARAVAPDSIPYFDVWATQVVRFGSPHPACHPTAVVPPDRRGSNLRG